MGSVERVFRVQFTKEAEADLEGLDPTIRRRVIERLRWLADNAESVRHEALTGSLGGLFRLRTGNYRTLYDLAPGEEIILVHAVGHRRDIYRRR